MEPRRDNLENLKHKDVTDKILYAFFKIVYPALGYGFLEKVYENAFVLALQQLSLKVDRQVKITVYFAGQVVGEYFADLIVEDCVIVELKAAEHILLEHEAQLLNYLRATKFEVGMLINFGPQPRFCRLVFSNDRKSTETWKKN